MPSSSEICRMEATELAGRVRARKLSPVEVVEAVLGAIAGPPVAQAISKRLPDHWHMFIGNTLSMAICTLLIVPALGLLSGFEAVPPA